VGLTGRFGGVEGGGGGAGAGGLWASVTAGRSVIAVRVKMRMRWLIDRFLGRKHDQIFKIVGRMSAQVKAQDSKGACAPMRRLTFPAGTTGMLLGLHIWRTTDAARWGNLEAAGYEVLG